MKRYKYIVASLIASAFLATGCSESFLEVSSPTDETINSYFTTDAHIQEAVVAAYDPLHWSDWAMGEYNPVTLMSDIMADDLWIGGQDRTDNQAWHLMMNFEAIPTNVIKGLWTVSYSGVKRCNDVITYLGWAGDNVTEENRKYYEAQVITLRVLYYNWLWKFWGNIPYYNTNLTSPYLAEQLSADQVYENIITDLEGVIASNALPMKEKADNYGRVTKAMTYMLYAEIVMYQNDESRYGKALQYMQEIIGSTQYGLLENYAGIFKEANEWGKESIFEVNYKDDDAIRSWDGPLNAGGMYYLHWLVRIPGLTEQMDMMKDGDSVRFVWKRMNVMPIMIPVVMPLAGMHRLQLMLIMLQILRTSLLIITATRIQAIFSKSMLHILVIIPVIKQMHS